MWIAVVLFTFILILLLYLDTRKPKNFPPGPAWLPILGSLLSINKIRNRTGFLYKTTVELSEKYGPVVGLKVGKDAVVIAHDYNSIKELLTKEDLQGRPTGPFYETRTWGIRRGVLLTDGHFWIEQRRFVLRHLRDFGYGRRDMATLVEDEAAQLVKNVKEDVLEQNGAIIKMNELFGIHVLNGLWSMMAGIRYSADDKELKNIQQVLSDLFANIDMCGSLFSQFPILRFIAPEFSGYRFFLDIHQRIWKFLKNELDNHKASYKPGITRDFMDVYLDVLHSDKDMEQNNSFSESQLLAICMDLFIAGSETTSKTINFGFLHILLNPTVQKKAQEEIDRVVGKERLPQLSDRPNLPYLEAIVFESIRMFMIRAFNVPHRALKDTTLGGYNIPKGTMLMANFNRILGQCNEPDVFQPERFLKDGKIHIPENYIPFGFGKHRCLGESLAKANIFLFITSLLQKFNFSVPPGTKPPSTVGIDGATPATDPYNALVTLRF